MHPKEYAHFLRISLGSLAELETQLRMAKDFGYLAEAEYLLLERRMDYVGRMLMKLLMAVLQSKNPVFNPPI